MTEVDLKLYGYSSFFAAHAASYPEWIPGRIVAQYQSKYRLVSSFGEDLGEIGGKFRYEAEEARDLPGVGDFVLLEPASVGQGTAVIRRLLPRRSVFRRKAPGTLCGEQVVAANIDTVFLCMSLNQNYNLRRLERYLTIAWDSGAKPVVVLTKADLSENPAFYREEAAAAALGCDTVAVSSLAEEGYQSLLPFLEEGKTAALLGSSGVGKSSLINALLGQKKLAAKAIRSDDKGRHTTTVKELFLLPGRGLIIDTPGLREVGLTENEGGLDKTFEDVEALFGSCRFSDCSHISEPGCAVQAALACGELPLERWLAYQKLKQEIAFADDASGYIQQKKEKMKKIAKINKNNGKVR